MGSRVGLRGEHRRERAAALRVRRLGVPPCRCAPARLRVSRSTRAGGDMALRRMRWTHDGADLIKPQPRDGATLPSITDPCSARRAVAHVHIHGGKVADPAAPRHPPVVHGDQPTGGLPLNRRTEDRRLSRPERRSAGPCSAGPQTEVTGIYGPRGERYRGIGSRPDRPAACRRLTSRHQANATRAAFTSSVWRARLPPAATPISATPPRCVVCRR